MAKREPAVVRQFGIEVTDPYKWLENLEAGETRDWITAQDALTKRSMKERAGVSTLAARLRAYQLPEIIGLPQIAAGRVFTAIRRGPGPILISELPPGGERREITSMPPAVPLVAWSIAPTARRLLHAAVRDGQPYWRLFEMDARIYTDELAGIAPNPLNVTWYPDGNSLVYVTTGGTATVLKRHVIGEAQAADQILFTSPEAGATIRPLVSDDGGFIAVSVQSFGRSHNRMFLLAPGAPAVELSAKRPAAYQFLGGDTASAYFKTTSSAPNGRVIAVELKRPASSRWRTVIPEGRQSMLSANLAGDRFVLTYSRDALATFAVFSREGKIQRTAELPGIGMTWLQASAGPGLSSSRTADIAFYQFLAANRQQTLYRFDAVTGASYEESPMRRGFDSDAYVLRHVKYRSADGSEVPLFLAHRRDLPRDGTNPVIFDAVGAVGVTALSFWSPNTFLFMEAGGVYAFAGIRGGEDYGERWRFAGSGPNRSRSVDDYIAAIDWLIAEKYTRAGRIAAISAGASTAVVAAAINRRPELLGAAALGSPVLDIFRAQDFAGGEHWTEETGAIRNATDARRARQWSPYANVKPGCYPAMLIVANENDSIAHPAHAYKYTAAVQAAQTCQRPIFLEVRWGQDYSAFGVNAPEQIAFFMDALGMPIPK